MEIRTERLFLTSVTLADAKDIQRLAGDRRIAYDALDIPHPFESGMAEEWIEKLHPNAGVFAIRRQLNEPLIGLVGLVPGRDDEIAELSYWIGKLYWGRGYASEAVSAILSFGFGHMKLKRIYATTLVRNAASRRILEKAGFKHEGCLRQHVKHWGVREDVNFFGLLQAEFKPDGPPRKVKHRLEV